MWRWGESILVTLEDRPAAAGNFLVETEHTGDVNVFAEGGQGRLLAVLVVMAVSRAVHVMFGHVDLFCYIKILLIFRQ